MFLYKIRRMRPAMFRDRNGGFVVLAEIGYTKEDDDDDDEKRVRSGIGMISVWAGQERETKRLGLGDVMVMGVMRRGEEERTRGDEERDEVERALGARYIRVCIAFILTVPDRYKTAKLQLSYIIATSRY